MYWIEPHNDPKILKLGIRWALYREKKPDRNKKKLIFWTFEISEWEEKSRIGYIKEPEWIDNNKVYVKNSGKSSEIPITYFASLYTEDFTKENLSHYYEGQQVESFKYVRKELKKEVEEDTGTSFVIKYTEQWQEVEQPEHQIESITRKNTWETNPKYTQFQEELKSGVILLEVITKE